MVRTASGARISLVATNVTWDEYLQNYHGKTLNTSNVTTGSESKENSTQSASSPAGQKIVDYASKWIGNPYKYGGDSLEHGIDCSHFVWRV